MKNERTVCMAQNLMRCVSKRYVYTGIWMAMLFTFTAAKGMAADTATLSFSGTIIAGTCDITTPPSWSFGDQSIDGLIGTTDKVLISKAFTVELSGCTGPRDSTKRPAIKVSSTTANGNQFKGDPNSTTAKGVYFIINNHLRPDQSPAWPAGATYHTSDMASTGDGLEPDSGDVFKDGTWYITAGLACGSSTDCSRSNLRAGDLSAPLTLEFIWK